MGVHIKFCSVWLNKQLINGAFCVGTEWSRHPCHMILSFRYCKNLHTSTPGNAGRKHGEEQKIVIFL